MDIYLPLPDDFIVFIPCKTDSKKKINRILRYLRDNNNVIIIGDENIYHSDINYLNKNYDMMDRRYEYCLNIISKAKMVVCPISD